MQHQISFLIQPIKTCDMEYEVDSRKDKSLKGQNNSDEPVVQIFDLLRRSGELRVVSVAHLAGDKNNKYNLHPNLLCNLPRKQQFCNESGVATYKFNTEMYNNDESVRIYFKNLCIRHSVKKNFNELKTKFFNSNEKFDPFGVGFSSNQKNVNLEYIRICCQAFFEDNEKTEPIVSDYIFNGHSDIKIEFWQEDFCVNIESTNQLLYVLVRKLSTEQRNGICGRFYNDYIDVIKKPEHNHHDSALVFTIPELSITFIEGDVVCNFQLLVIVENKELYKSDVKQFKYTLSRIKRVSENFLNDLNRLEYNENQNKRPRLTQTNHVDSYFKILSTNEQIINQQADNTNSNHVAYNVVKEEFSSYDDQEQQQVINPSDFTNTFQNFQEESNNVNIDEFLNTCLSNSNLSINLPSLEIIP